MPTGTLNKTKVTLSDFEQLTANLDFTNSTASVGITGTYTINPNDISYSVGGGSVSVGLMNTVRLLIKRDIPSLTTGYAEDTTARQVVTLSAKEASTNKTTCVTTVGSTDLIDTIEVYDSLLPISALTTPSVKVLSNRSFICKLPKTSAPICLSVYARVQSSQLDGTGPVWEAEPDKITNIAMGYATATNDVKTIIVGSQAYRNEFTDCLSHLLLTKEFGGNYLAVGFSESVSQPSSQKEYVQTYPAQSIDVHRPFRAGSRPQRNIQLFRDNIRGHERDTFRAFLEGTQFWMWVEELGEYRSASVTFGNSIDDSTTELTANVTIDAY